MVILGPTLDKCPEPRVVISKALENAGISARKIEAVNITVITEGKKVIYSWVQSRTSELRME